MRKPSRLLLMLRPPKKLQADRLLFTVVFLLGSALGFLAGSLVSEARHQELASYILDYSRSASAHNSTPVFGLLFSYFRLPAALCVLGFAACGAWLIPLLVAGHGFLLAFSIRCFSDVLGRSGAFLALPSMGIRCLFVLPCMFYLACRGWNEAKRRKKISVRERPERASVYPLLICGLILMIGCILDSAVSPKLITMIIQKIS